MIMKKTKDATKAKQVKAAFGNWMATGQPEIRNKKGEVFHFAEGELISKVSENYCYYWYITTRGNLISFNNPKKPTWIMPDSDGRVQSKKNKKANTVRIYQIMADTFGIPKSFYEVPDSDCEIHHPYPKKLFPEKTNDLNNMQKVPKLLHDAVHMYQRHIYYGTTSDKTETERMIRNINYYGIESPVIFLTEKPDEDGRNDKTSYILNWDQFKERFITTEVRNLKEYPCD